MKAFMWGLVVICVLIVAYFVYDSQRIMQVPVEVPVSSTTTDTWREILPGIPSVLYTDPQFGFSTYYPATAALKADGFEGYLTVTGSPVVAITLNPDMFTGTNLSDAGLYVGATTTASVVARCAQPGANSGEIATASSTVINGTSFAEFDSSDAGAGNMYAKKSFRTVSRDACLEFVEVLHSTQLGNYPKNTVGAFDSARFSSILDAILQTVSVASSTAR